MGAGKKETIKKALFLWYYIRINPGIKYSDLKNKLYGNYKHMFLGNGPYKNEKEAFRQELNRTLDYLKDADILDIYIGDEKKEKFNERRHRNLESYVAIDEYVLFTSEEDIKQKLIHYQYVAIGLVAIAYKYEINLIYDTLIRNFVEKTLNLTSVDWTLINPFTETSAKYYLQLAKEHLESNSKYRYLYEKIYGKNGLDALFQKKQELKKRAEQKVKEHLNEKISDDMFPESALTYKGQNFEQIATILFINDDINSVLNSVRESENVTVRLFDVPCCRKEYIEQAKSAIKEAFEKITNERMEFKNLSEKYNKIKEELEPELRNLILTVIQGQPLSGYCSVCKSHAWVKFDWKKVCHELYSHNQEKSAMN